MHRLQLKIGAEPTQLNLPCCLYINDTCDISNDDILIFKRERNKYLYIFGFFLVRDVNSTPSPLVYTAYTCRRFHTSEIESPGTDR